MGVGGLLIGLNWGGGGYLLGVPALVFKVISVGNLPLFMAAMDVCEFVCGQWITEACESKANISRSSRKVGEIYTISKRVRNHDVYCVFTILLFGVFAQ